MQVTSCEALTLISKNSCRFLTFLANSISSASLTVELNCNFTTISVRFSNISILNYTSCNVVKNPGINDREVKVSISNTTNISETVEAFQVISQTMKFLPINLGVVFKNLKALIIRKSELEEISKNDLAQMANLIYLNLTFNNLTVISKDTFDGNLMLEIIILNNNQIKHIHPDTFDKLWNLQRVEIKKSPCLENFTAVRSNFFSKKQHLVKCKMDEKSNESSQNDLVNHLTMTVYVLITLIVIQSFVIVLSFSIYFCGRKSVKIDDERLTNISDTLRTNVSMFSEYPLSEVNKKPKLSSIGDTTDGIYEEPDYTEPNQNNIEDEYEEFPTDVFMDFEFTNNDYENLNKFKNDAVIPGNLKFVFCKI